MIPTSHPCPHNSPISEKDIDAHLMTSKGGSPPLDILIRTSGVKRLSDYLLWQVRVISTNDTHLHLLHPRPRHHLHPRSHPHSFEHAITIILTTDPSKSPRHVTSRSFPVLRRHTDPVLRDVLARLWPARFYTHSFGLPAQTVGSVICIHIQINSASFSARSSCPSKLE